jgi:hypothetical protein
MTFIYKWLKKPTGWLSDLHDSTAEHTPHGSRTHTLQAAHRELSDSTAAHSAPSQQQSHTLSKQEHAHRLFEQGHTHTHTLFKRQLVCFPEVCVCACVGSAQVVARQSVLSLKAAMRKMTLDEDEIEEVLARAGLQPEEPQYGAFLGLESALSPPPRSERLERECVCVCVLDLA